ncbi:hypothetical protein ACWD4T_42770 [Streptomyces umbrinus]
MSDAPTATASAAESVMSPGDNGTTAPSPDPRAPFTQTCTMPLMVPGTTDNTTRPSVAGRKNQEHG